MNSISRRHILGTIPASILVGSASKSLMSSAAANSSQAHNPAVLPPRLREGDMVGLVATASTISEDALNYGKQNIESLGLKTAIGKHALNRHGYLAGTDRDRAADLNAMFANKDIKAIFTARGGWGSARMLRYLNWDIIRQNPKLLIGYSDVTALHLAIAAKAGFPSIHGPNAANGWAGLPSESFRAMAMQGERLNIPSIAPPDPNAPYRDYQPYRMLSPGKASGKLIGGNLSVLSALVGSQWMPDMSDAILFLEDVGEEEYRVDRMLTQLSQAGILNQISGFIFGQCRRCSKNIDDYKGFTLPNILRQHIAPLNIPAFTGGHFGHIRGQYCLPMGARIEMDADIGSVQMIQAITR